MPAVRLALWARGSFARHGNDARSEPFCKATGFYLRGLPPLVPTNKLVPPRKAEEPERHAKWSAIHRASPGPDRWKIRSRTFQGLAEACADQWGAVPKQQEAIHG